MKALLCIPVVAWAFLAMTTASATPQPNILFVVVDNMRPSIGPYKVPQVITPAMEAFAAQPGATIFSRAYSQIPWCAPSRNSFLTGRNPQQTKAWNFRDSFRENGIGSDWVTLPGYFKQNGYYTTSSGKVFHPDLPANFDYPQSWSDKPYFPVKPTCPNNTMTCEFSDGNGGRREDSSNFFDADTAATDVILQRMSAYLNESDIKETRAPFFAALGLQSPRLPWSYPASAARQYPNASAIPGPTHPNSPDMNTTRPLEWFRPTEVDVYSDIQDNPITHDSPMPMDHQQAVRRAYYAAITHVDAQFSRVLNALKDWGVADNTIVALVADHGQNLGEHNMWSMMNLLETSTRVPMVFYYPPSMPRGSNPASPVVGDAVELVDLYPTLASLASLDPPPYQLAGRDLSPLMFPSQQRARARVVSRRKGFSVHQRTFIEVGERGAISQITRCYNCTLAYAGSDDPTQCEWDRSADANSYTVPCCETPRSQFDYMGITIRTKEWRYSVYCKWDGATLSPDWSTCGSDELYDHRSDPGIPYNVDDYENVNLMGDSRYTPVAAELAVQLRVRYTSS